jgi:membrane protease YdiL (CAAX protease family)
MSQTFHSLSNEAAYPASAAGISMEVTRPRIWTIWVTLGATAIAMFIAQTLMFVGIFAYFLINGKELEEIEPLLLGALANPPIFILMLFFGPGIFGLGALVAAYFSPEPLRERLGFLPVQVPRSIYPLSIMGSLFPMVAGFALAGLLVQLLPESMSDKSFVQMFEKLTPFWSIPFVIFIGLIPGFCEEMLFRGYVQRRFIRRWQPFWGITLSSILFGLAHVMPVTVVFATVVGFYLGVLAWKCGSIWPSIACHIFINSSINLWRVIIKFGEIPEGAQTIAEWTILGISALCFLATLRLLYRRNNGQPVTSVSDTRTPKIA